MNKPLSSQMPWVRAAGWAGLLAALLVGIGEYTIQFSLEGDYASPGYEYFEHISRTRLFAGHYLSVLAAPLYLVGYWHLSRNLAPSGHPAATVFFLLGSYAFAVGAVWLGQRAFMATVVQSIAEGLPLVPVLEQFAQLNEPLVNVLRLAVLVNSVIWVALILRGQSAYPRWSAAVCPILMLALIFGLYFVAPSIGRFLLPGAMNVVHLVLFAVSLATTRSQEQ